MSIKIKLLWGTFVLCNAALYCSLLPLWEGFDEPFHYGYVQSIATGRGFPILRRTRLSAEISESLAQVPVSFVLKRALPGTISFEDWYPLTPDQKAKRQEALLKLSPKLRFGQSKIQNYEAQQSPLAYLVLAPIDFALSTIPLSARVLMLRLFLALFSSLLTFFACRLLCKELSLQPDFSSLLLFCTFGAQIYWASVAHISNDWLSIPLAICFMAVLLRFGRATTRNDAFLLSASLGLGLLAKAYFMAFVPVFLLAIFWMHFRTRISIRTTAISFAIPLALAGPWYARNALLYRSVTGMQESVAGARSTEIFKAFRQIDWPRSLVESARWGLWSGNESHLSFSRNTLNLELLLLLAGLMLLVLNYKLIARAEWWLMIATGAFLVALIYDLCLTWADTHGAQTTTGPYYTPCILPAIFGLAFLGLQRSGLAGRVLAIAICSVTFWIALLSYAVKLIPFYGGFADRSNIASVFTWWQHDPQADLQGLTLATPFVVFFLLALFVALLVITAVLTIRQLVNRPVS